MLSAGTACPKQMKHAMMCICSRLFSGTKRVKYLEENIAAFNIQLSKEDLAEIEEAVPHDKV